MTVLAIDTAFDRISRAFADGRESLYDELAAEGVVIRRTSGATHRDSLFDALRSEELDAIVISAHGAPEGVFDADGSWLIREDDSIIASLARARRLYFCCCETGSGGLFSRLRQSGAVQVVGFRGKPQWGFPPPGRLWQQFDCALVRAIITRECTVESVRDEYLAKLSELVPVVSEEMRPDLVNMQHTLTTMNF